MVDSYKGVSDEKLAHMSDCEIRRCGRHHDIAKKFLDLPVVQEYKDFISKLGLIPRGLPRLVVTQF